MVKIEAYQCGWCHRCFLRPCDAARHEAACSNNPARRACKTCVQSGARTTAETEEENIQSTTYRGLWCNHPDIDLPLRDQPYFTDCDWTSGQCMPSRPIPGTCDHYEYKGVTPAHEP